MYDLRDEHFERSVKRFEQRDPDLYRELRDKIASKRIQRPERAEEMMRASMVMAPIAAAGPEVMEAIGPVTRPKAKAMLGMGGPGGAAGGPEAADAAMFQHREAETIVRQNARPVMVIRDNRVTAEFLGPDSQVWAGRVMAAQALLDQVIPSIGRVEVNNNPDFSWLGTGWLVDDSVIVTNRHVAREFARLGSDGFTFRMGVGGAAQSARLDFLEEYQRANTAEFDIESILWIATPSEPDVAFLRVRQTSGPLRLPRPLKLATKVDPDEMVATIGYPARDSRVPDQALVTSIFGDVYEKKRLAPGQVMEVADEEMQHDCSTLGGNSGSPIVRLATGEVVGLHFSGVFMTANYAVPAPKVRELMLGAQRNELRGMGPVRVPGNGGGAASGGAAGNAMAAGGGIVGNGVQGGAGGEYSLRFNIPVEITVRVGGPDIGGAGVVVGGAVAGAAGGGAASGGSGLDEAVRAARSALKNVPGVLNVRKGYRFKRGWITGERAVVVEMRRKLGIDEMRAEGVTPIPAQFGGFGVDVRTASLVDQIGALGVRLESVGALEGPPSAGGYREPENLKLERVREKMKATFHASPDSGWPNLKAFLSRVKQHLTATMYEWEPNHISDAVEKAVKKPSGSLRMVTQKAGTREAVEDMQGRLAGKFKHVWASVGSGKLIPSAYHIKVASRDGEEVWLSSGNWKDSNQPDMDPAGADSASISALRQHNREWHAILENKTLATMFQRYIEWDFQEAQRVPVPEAVEAPEQYLFVPLEAFETVEEARVRVEYFDPLSLDRELDIQALLTPDRDDRGRRVFISTAVAMMGRAQRTLLVENQSFNLLAENVDEFEEFFSVVRDKQRAGLDVRIIFRDPREFGRSGGADLQRLLETVRDFGIDTDAIKVQKRCHTKGIIVDDQEVMLGSHNLTNAGALYNRDASLLVRDAEVAKYFRQIFEFDWKTLAVQEADELVEDVRLAREGEPTPAGYRKVSVSEALGTI